jgi:hypothetical protein
MWYTVCFSAEMPWLDSPIYPTALSSVVSSIAAAAGHLP